jgi:PAS domain S-box-containing protein
VHFRRVASEGHPPCYLAALRGTSEHPSAGTLRRWHDQRFRALVLAVSQIVWHTDPEGMVRGALPSWQEYTGQSEEEVQGNGWASAVHPDDVAHTLAAWRKAVAARAPYDVEYRIRGADGDYRLFHVRGVPLLDVYGTVREWIGTCTDVTEARRAELELNRFFDLSLDLMCVASPDGFFRRVNPAFERTLGYTQEELLGRPFYDFVHPDDRAATEAVAGQLALGLPLASFENRYRCKDGGYRWFLWASAAADGLFYATARDITERKADELTYRDLNATLDRRVAERTAQLERANQELEAFTYSVSHDLRAPLRGIDSFSRMVIEDLGPRVDAEERRKLEVIRGEAKRMGMLIDDLLAFSKLGRTELRRVPIAMAPLARSVFAELPEELRSRVKSFRVGALPDAVGDRAMIRQVLFNLIGNAAKFSGTRPEPTVEVDGETVDGMATYRVRDNGVGFDPRYAHKLFGVFQRLHAEHEFEGTGVGLAIVKRVVHRHGGPPRRRRHVHVHPSHPGSP